MFTYFHWYLQNSYDGNALIIPDIIKVTILEDISEKEMFSDIKKMYFD